MNTKTKYSHEEINKMLADAWLNIQVDDDKLFNPLNWPDSFADKPEEYITWIMGRPEYFSFICSEILNIELIPTQALMLQEMWNRKFPMIIASRGFGKSFCMALYALLRILLLPGRKLIIAGAAFRQSKVIFEYMEAIYNNAPLLRSIVNSYEGDRNGPRHENDMYSFYIGTSVCRAIPIGDGSKIRGQRANDLLCDEFASIPKEIFENVLAGFAAVSSTPIENVKDEASKEMARQLGVYVEEEYEDAIKKDNQIILSGTAYYDFNHFADYWKDWHEIITSRGDKRRLKEYFRRKSSDGTRENDEIPDDFDYSNYSIIRIPFELIPRGFMDAAQVARSKATIHSGIYLMEFGAVFSTDSNGFFKRRLIESCVASPTNPISLFSSADIFFEANTYGNQNRRYVYGIDPASEVDNFAIIVLELWPEHARIVYGWTTNREQHKHELDAGIINEHDFYSYCAKKIRQLMKRFPCERIMLDSQGGGVGVIEALHDPDKMVEGDVPIWEVIEDGKEKDTDFKAGSHIVEMVNFADAAWTAEANNGLRKDMEDKAILFPFFDAITIATAAADDKLSSRIYDSVEDCVMEIEELKDELSTIVITRTPSGRDKWDTPEVKLPGGKKGRLRKDRYSALVMANMGARQLRRDMTVRFEPTIGGFAQSNKADEGLLYSGNEWFNEQAKNYFDAL